ncbi:S-layer family protein [Keratinibaculum paraultunense]|uniref:S-layer family protein n=1 Tax=Keratinibaculum paraultunense TaxID=1278232 RepID=A0A4R3L0L9_9FIRM|nr:S-layer homology domain-containing protein [Keratinibaculum paraultunense]QQY79926.1 S-layer homology domain-containing protein [Keratinibaculum paraultunense]TCS91755.1 S-layer family protein [Keratinibaculum paraultunense]
MNRKISILLLSIFILNMFMPTALSCAKNISYTDINKHWAKGDILKVSALGYMEGSKGKFYPNRNLTYGELLTTVIRAIGKEGEAQRAEPKNYIEGVYKVAYSLKLIEKGKGSSKLCPSPNTKVTRAEAANVLGRALGVEPPLGHEIREVKKFKDYNKINDYRLPYVELILQKGYMKGRSNTIFDPNSYITRGEFAKVLSNASDDLIHFIGITKKMGQVSNKELGNITIYNTDTTSTIVGYKGEDAFPVQKNKKIYSSEVINVGDFITYYMDSNGKVIYGEINTNKESTIKGTIRQIDLKNREITLWGYNNKTYKFKLDPFIDMENLYFEQEVSIVTRGNQVVKITAFDNIDPERDGSIIPGTRFRVGTVLSASNDEIQIKTNEGIEKFQIDPFYTTVYKRGQRAELFQLKEGDRILLTFDDIYSPLVSEIKIEDEEKHIQGVIKGKIELVDSRNKEILISEPYRLDRGKWIPMNEKQKLKLGTGIIYEGGKKLALQNLNKRKGEEVYIAYENPYGYMSISKMLLKSGPSMEYKDKIQDIDYGIGKIVVDTNSFDIHDGTIVIKDNRLVDPLNLDFNQNVYLVSDYRYGKKGASVIAIEDVGIIDDRIDGTKLLVYKGKIEDIFDHKLTLGRYNYKLDKEILTSSGFKSNPGSEQFTLTLDTLIYDSQLEKQVPTKSFLDSRYIDIIDIKDKELRERIEKDYYKNKPAYVVAKDTPYGKQILAINLVPQDLNKYNETVRLDQSISGEIKEINEDNKTITLTNTKSYNNLTGRWEYIEDKNLNLNKAIIIVNDKPLPIEEIYKLRNKSKAYVIEHNDSSVDIPYIILIED